MRLAAAVKTVVLVVVLVVAAGRRCEARAAPPSAGDIDAPHYPGVFPGGCAEWHTLPAAWPRRIRPKPVFLVGALPARPNQPPHRPIRGVMEPDDGIRGMRSDSQV